MDPRHRSRLRVLALLALGAALGAVACGGTADSGSRRSGSARAAGTVCLPQTRAAVARFLHVPAARVSTATATGSNAMPQCSFTVNIATRTRVVLTANVDTSPQPYFRLERTAVETYQMFAPTGAAQPPRPVDRLGLEAYWFPDRAQLMSTDGKRLLTVTVAWRRSRQARTQALAVAASRPYLHTPRPRSSSSLTRGAAAPV